MAEVLVGAVMKTMVSEIVRQALQQGARRLELERARGRYLYGDTTPEEQPLNLCLVGEVFLQLFATGFGSLASIWATVVLLGGFATILEKMDFWFVTVIVFIQSARIIGFNPYPEAKFFSDAPQAYIDLYIEPSTQKDRTRSANGRNPAAQHWRFLLFFRFLADAPQLMGQLAMTALLITIAPVAAALSCMVLSIVRLVDIAGKDYGGASTDATKANVKPALIFFYALVLTQGAFLYLYLGLRFRRRQVARSLRNKCGFDTKETTKLIDKYIDSTLDRCIQAGVSNTIKRNLVSFAQDLLKNESDDGHITAVSVLRTLVEQDAHRARAVSQIQSSEKSIGRLIGMLSSKSLVDNKTKKCTAAVVAKLARDMHLADIPGAIRSISSLLDPPSVNRVKQATDVNQQVQNQNPGTTNTTESKTLIAHGLMILSKLCGDPDNCSENQQVQNQNPGTTNTTESKALIAHGLMIFSELCGDPDNCSEILKTNGLVSKIIAPLHNGFYPGKTDDDACIEIIKESLGVVTKLVRGAGGNGRVLTRQFLGDANSINEMVRNITGDEQRSETLLIDIVKQLALDEARRGNFQHMSDFVSELLRLCFGDNSNEVGRIIDKLLLLFFDANNSEDAITAAAALTALARSSEDNCRMIIGASATTGTGQTVIGKLADMLDSVTHVKHLTVIAQMLSHFCAMPIAQEQTGCLEPLRSEFTLVLLVTLHKLPESRQNQMEPNERKWLAALLSLAVQMITTNLFPAALFSIAPDRFVKKLKEIIERNSESTPDCLEIIRATVTLSICLMEENHITKQSFQQEKIDEVLKNAAETMLELERCMLLTGSVADTASYETLSSLVQRTNDLILMPQP